MNADEQKSDQWARLTEAVGKLSLSTIMAVILALVIYFDFRSDDKFNDSLIEIQRQSATYQERQAAAMEKNADAMQSMAANDQREQKLLELLTQYLRDSKSKCQ